MVAGGRSFEHTSQKELIRKLSSVRKRKRKMLLKLTEYINQPRIITIKIDACIFSIVHSNFHLTATLSLSVGKGSCRARLP